MTTSRRLAAPVVGVALVLGLAGCTASASGSGSSAGRLDSGVASAAASAPLAAASASGGSGSVADAAEKNRDIVRTGTLELASKDPVGVARRIGAIVTGAEGHLDADTEQPGRDARADLTARIPSSVFDATLQSIRATGTVRSLSLHESDVTDQVTDDAVRIRALEASVDRLTTLLGRATDTSDLVSLESALTQRESDLQSLQTEQRGLADQVSYASLTVSIVTPATAPVYRPGTFASGFAGGLAALAATGAWLAVAAGVLAPWVLVAAILVGVAAGVRWIARRRRRNDAGPAAHGAG